MKNVRQTSVFMGTIVLTGVLWPVSAAFAYNGQWRPDPSLMTTGPGYVQGLDSGAAALESSYRFMPRGAAAAPSRSSYRPHPVQSPSLPGYRPRQVQSNPMPGYRPQRAAAGVPGWPRPVIAQPAWHGYAPPAPWMPVALPVAPGYAPAHMAAMPMPPQWPAFGQVPVYAPAMPWMPGSAPVAQVQPELRAARTAPVYARRAGMQQPFARSGWRPEAGAASPRVGAYAPGRSAYTSSRQAVFRGGPVAAWQGQDRSTRVNAVAATGGNWRPQADRGWAPSQAFRPLAYGRSLARSEAVDRAVPGAAGGGLPGWATTLDFDGGPGACTWCSSGT